MKAHIARQFFGQYGCRPWFKLKNGRTVRCLHFDDEWSAGLVLSALVEARAKSDLLNQFKLIWAVQSRWKKFSALPPTQIKSIFPIVSSHKGAARDRHGREAGCGGRFKRE
jgi:hypothetical protein